MGEASKIEWTDHTFNAWLGCTKVSPACDHCYAESWAKRSGLVKWGNGEDRRLTSGENWKKPLRWNRKAEREGWRYRVFANSLSDVFDAEVPDEWRDRLFALVALTPNLDWLLLTKRPNVALKYVTAKNRENEIGAALLDLDDDHVLWRHSWPFRNFAVGTTIETRKLGQQRAWELAQIPAAKHFWSLEPLLEDLGDLTPLCLFDTIDGRQRAVDWVIVGGESGPHARYMHPDWARSIRDQCKAAGVPFFMKQMTGKAPIPDDLMVRQFPDWLSEAA